MEQGAALNPVQKRKRLLPVLIRWGCSIFQLFSCPWGPFVIVKWMMLFSPGSHHSPHSWRVGLLSDSLFLMATIHWLSWLEPLELMGTFVQQLLHPLELSVIFSSCFFILSPETYLILFSWTQLGRPEREAPHKEREAALAFCLHAASCVALPKWEGGRYTAQQ